MDGMAGIIGATITGIAVAVIAGIHVGTDAITGDVALGAAFGKGLL